MDPGRTDPFSDDPSRGYALSGKIMLSAIVVLFFVIILMVCLHLYARWYLLRARRRHVQRASNRRTQLVFYVDPNNPNGQRVTLASRGLDETVLKALPIFTYSSETHPDPIECAVCLSEFEDKETGRTLPKCNHSFHVECIDMWFHTHSTCPLCRSPVEAPENPVEFVTESGSEVAGSGSGSGSSPGMCAACEHEGESVGAASTSSFEGRRKPVELMGVTIEVPRRNGGFDQDELTTESPASQAYRSPMSRMLSFKRILSRDRRGSCSSSCGVELDLERGGEERPSELSVELNSR